MTEYIWINEGGESCCGKESTHGGITLMTAIEAREWKPLASEDKGTVEMLTNRNHWIGFPVGTVSTVLGETYEITCEYCDSKE